MFAPLIASQLIASQRPKSLPMVSPSPVRLARRGQEQGAGCTFGRSFADIAPEPVAAGRVQPKLVIGAPEDRAEKEADRVAEQIVASRPGSEIVEGGGLGLRRKCAECEKEEESGTLARKAEAGRAGAGGFAPPIVHDVLAKPGAQLSPDLRAFFEPRFGHDFAKVRIHADGQATESARAVNAQAYTVGNHIVLGGRRADKRLLAHELTHVVQQGGGAPPALRRQRKTVGGPLDMEFDPCVSAADHQLCVSDLQGACEKLPSLPGCGFICHNFGCKKSPPTPSMQCPPGWHTGASKDFAGQCCKSATESAQDCCPPSRVAFAEGRCCPGGTTVVDGACKSVADLPPLPGQLCPPWQRTVGGECCTPPKVPIGTKCGLPSTPEPDRTTPGEPVPQLGTLWTDAIHFVQDQPDHGAGAVLTPEGVQELESVRSWLAISSDLEIRLIGSASWEGPEAGRDEYNQGLAARRVKFVANALKGFGDRIADPASSDGAETGCDPIGPGRWSCGAKNAPPGSARPEDRVVRVTFARNRLKLPDLKLEPPRFKPGG